MLGCKETGRSLERKQGTLDGRNGSPAGKASLSSGRAEYLVCIGETRNVYAKTIIIGGAIVGIDVLTWAVKGWV